MDILIENVSVPIIVGIVYGAVELIKKITNNNEKVLAFMPLIALFLGTMSGIVAFYGFTGVIAAQNIWSALVIGAASGLSATGANQVFKQISKTNSEENEDGASENEND